MQSFHYFPLAWPFLLLLVFLAVMLVLVVEFHLLAYAYEKIGIGRRYVMSLLLLSLIGAYINIPVARLPEKEVTVQSQVEFFGVRYVVPDIKELPPTIVAINLGGALIPTVLSLYLLLRNRLFLVGPLGVVLVTAIVHSLGLPGERDRHRHADVRSAAGGGRRGPVAFAALRPGRGLHLRNAGYPDWRRPVEPRQSAGPGGADRLDRRRRHLRRRVSDRHHRRAAGLRPGHQCRVRRVR